MAYERKGERQVALQEYRTASELNPNIPTYKLGAYERLLQQGKPLGTPHVPACGLSGPNAVRLGRHTGTPSRPPTALSQIYT